MSDEQNKGPEESPQTKWTHGKDLSFEKARELLRTAHKAAEQSLVQYKLELAKTISARDSLKKP